MASGRRRFSAGFAAVLPILIAACATLPPLSLSVKQVQGLKVVGVDVAFTDTAELSWPDEERAFALASGYVDTPSGMDSSSQAASKKPAAPSYEDITKSPAAKDHLKKFIAPRVKAAFETALATEPAGTQPVRVKVVVSALWGTPAALCVAVGGNNSVVGSAAVVDASGKELARIAELSGLSGCSGVLISGVAGALMSAAAGDRSIAVSEAMAKNFKTWLLTDRTKDTDDKRPKL